MAVELATAYVSLVPSARGISAGIARELSSPTQKAAATAGASASKAFGSKFQTGLKAVAATAFGLFAFQKIAGGIASVVGAAEESRKVTSQTNAVLKSTGSVANVSAAGVAKLADQLSLKSGIDDELIQSGANVLLTFTRVRNEVGKGNDIFSQAATVANDMSVALGTDLQSSTIAVGKALNDPIRGLVSLRRVGVQFTAQQEEQIKAMVESGDVLGAQKIILKELNTEFGGSAAAQATATEKLKVAFGNIAEQIGGVLLPYVDQFSNWMLREGIPLVQDKLVPAIKRLAEWIANELVPAIRDDWLPAAARIGRILQDKVLPVLDRLGDAFLGMGGNAQLGVLGTTAVVKGLAPRIAVALAGLGATIGKSAAKAFGRLAVEAVKGTGKVLVALGRLAVEAAVATGRFVAQILIQAARWAWLGVQALLAAAKVAAAWLISLGPIGLVIAAVAGAAALIIANWDKIKRFVTAAATAVVDFLKAKWPLLLAILTGPIGVAVLLIVRNWDTIKRIFRAGVDFVISLWTTAWETVKSTIANALSVILSTITTWRDRIIGFFANAVSWLLQAGRNIVKGLWQGALEIASQFFGYIGRIPGRIRDTFVNAGRWLIDAGKRILQGLWDGLKDKWKDVTDWIGGLGSAIVNLKGPPEKDLLLLKPAGHNIMQGFFDELKRGQGPIFRLMQRIGMTIAAIFGQARGVGGGALSGLEDRFEGIVRQILKLGRGQIRLVSGFRSSAQQARLYARYLAGTGNLAAPPGRSKHERGLAVDFGGNRSLYTRLAHRFGLVAPVRGEPWHWQPTWAGQSRSYYQAGTWRTRDEWARLHRDEMVIPAGLASALRALPGGPGGTGGRGTGGALIGTVNVYATTVAEGRAAAKGFIDVLERRRIQTDARIA